ncbi:MAG: hypothetical protein KC668_25260, partial [Myxococcales bacterium]|nr:hypothetical protein [Myxococcales bacterium]
CACNAGYTGNGVTCSDVNECTNGTNNCNANAACTNTPGSFSCACNMGYTGNGVTCTDINECTNGTAACSPNATCNNTPGSYGCTCNAGYVGDGFTCTAPAFCDVVYRVAGTFQITNPPACSPGWTNNIGTNAANPALSGGATTPFTVASSWDNGMVRLRFPANGAGNAPVAGAVSLIEYYMPLEFSTSCSGATVTTNVDHSVGILAMSGTPATIPVSPSISRTCSPWASGTAAGNTLSWSTCDVVNGNDNRWPHSDAQGNGTNEAGCAKRMSVWGAVTCSGGALVCGFVPGLGNQRATWEQVLNNFTFSSSNYTTASFTMPSVEVPESTNNDNTRTYIAITSATVLSYECGQTAALTCNEF